MPDNVLVQPPNLFDFATSELSQDAFICWLASWANPALKEKFRALHATGAAFLDRLLEVGRVPKLAECRYVEIHRQWNGIDVLIVLNGDTAIVIEDKTDTKDHSGQLRRYKQAVGLKFPADRIAAVYLKTGDQGTYKSVDEAGYGRFLRRHFLDILEQGERDGVRSDIFADFLQRLRRVEDAVQSYRSVPISKWNDDWSRWKGFYSALQGRLEGESNWDYVPYPGDFMGFWWHWRGDKYLQLENEKLCFKIMIEDKARQMTEWLGWHAALMAESVTGGLKLTKPVRRPGRFMTVAVLAEGYRQSNVEEHLDMARTVETLQKAEALMDAALLRLARTAGKGDEPQGGVLPVPQ